jgi:hypothetical protein
MRAIIENAIKVRRDQMALGIPMNINQGFKEASLAAAFWVAFSQAGYLGYPEFPYRKGSIDAVFVRHEEVVVCEWKRVTGPTASAVMRQTARMLTFDPNRELCRHRFCQRKYRKRLLWACDTWERKSADWWLGEGKASRKPRPFGDGWKVGMQVFDSFGEGWYPYFWLWAFL